jgi:hypothetical protein
MTDIAAGVYKHYKGGLYLMLGAAQHEGTGERLVAYIQLSGKVGPKIWVRPYDQFFENVDAGGVIKPRFVYIGEGVSEVFAKWYDPLGGYHGADRDDS